MPKIIIKLLLLTNVWSHSLENEYFHFQFHRMKASLTLFSLSLCLSLFSQQSNEKFGQYMQSYYQDNHDDLVEVTIEVINQPSTDFKRFEPIITGFFGALFQANPNVKEEFSQKMETVTRPEFQTLLETLSTSDIDSIYDQTPLSPAFNDMHWSSFFATGNTKYLDPIIQNTKLATDRVDRNLFLTGASAKWSLSSNAKYYDEVRAHLESLRKSHPEIKEILKKEPFELKQEMIDVIKAERAKGNWLED